MEWTSQPPKVDGYYWWRRTTSMIPDVLLIFRGKVWFANQPQHKTVDEYPVGGEWWGPIPVPPENRKVKEGV